MAAKRGRPPKPEGTANSIHLGFRVSKNDYDLLTAIVADENERLENDGYAVRVTTIDTIRRLIRDEAARRKLTK
jgi:hypothetical protein